jgi:two-component system, response regulator / RNA-binding antiterminator
MTDALRIVVISPDLAITDTSDSYAISQAERSRSIRIGLLENDFNLVASLPADVFLTELEHVVMATRDARRPIVMFTNDHDTSNARAAVAAGVSAYIVAGLQPDRIRPILDVAMARFEQEQALRQELANTRSELHELSTALQDRKVIDRAKNMLMQRQQLTEDVAYAKLRKTAMDKNLKIVDVAQRMLDVADLMA